MEKTPLYVRSTGNERAIPYTVMAVQDFGKEVLNRDFEVTSWVDCLPKIETYEKDGKVKVDSYKQALWNLYNQNKCVPIFTAETTEKILVPERFHNRVYASSAQYMDLTKDTVELITPDKAGVIISDWCDFEDEKHQNAMAYFLATHEMGHLALGDRVCNSDNCVFSHNYSALPRVLEYILTNNKSPVCDFDKRRIDEFRKRWGIK